MEWIRHGDVILTKTNTKFSGKKLDNVILAWGEVTGHKHQLRGQLLVENTEGGPQLIEVLSDNAELTHEEHDTLLIPKGIYEVVIQREVDLLGHVRQVID